MSTDGPAPSYNDLLELGKRIQEKAAEALAEELDSQGVNKTGDQNYFEDLFGINDYWAEDFMGDFAQIPYQFAQAAGANPDQLDGIIGYLTTTSGLLADERIQDLKEDIKDATFDWEGDGALNFRMFIRPLYHCAGNQLLLIDALIVILRSYQEVLRQARRDVQTVGEETEAALDMIIGGDLPSSEALLYAFNMLVTVTLTAVDTAANPISIGVAIANKIWSDVSALIQSNLKGGGDEPAAPKGYGIGNTLGSIEASTHGVIRDMSAALTDVEAARADAEDLIATSLMEVLASIEEHGRDKFEAPRPNIADDMSQLTSDGPYGFGGPG